MDAVTIAAPTVSHVDLALPFLEAGIATLVEKPIAPHALLAKVRELLDRQRAATAG